MTGAAGSSLRRIAGRDGPLLLAAPILGLVVLAAVFADVLAPYDPLAINPVDILASPSADHILGTDEIGRDLLSRIIHGARVSLSVAVAAVAVACLVGVPVGVGASYFGGRLESLVMRTVDVFVSMPEIFVAIVVLAFLGGSLPALVFTIGLLYFPQFARVAHGMTASSKSRDHVLAAVSLGAGPFRIIWREILPNMRPVVIVQASFTLSFAMLLEAGLSFLGLGVMPPQPSWGQMIGSLKDYLFTNPWPVVFPSLVLFATILAVNLLGDWLQDRLNPELGR
jgi:peptide/nickel transport system permease protein